MDSDSDNKWSKKKCGLKFNMAEVIYKVKKIDVKIYIKNQELKKML